MKKFIRAITTILLIVILLGMTACHTKQSLKEFNIKNISGFENEDYFTSSQFDFARVEDVVIIPEIKEINYDEYIIYVTSYSKTEKEVTVKNVCIKENEKTLLEHQLNKKVSFNKNAQNIFTGVVDGETFNKDDIAITDGKSFNLIVQVEVQKDDISVVTDITYEVNVKTYKSFVMQ
ncbi:MAG: hypothetical protein ACI4II_02770 [Acutalibacteraceae bacterium]